MKIFSTDHYVLPLPDGHTFPMTKYRRLRESVEASGLIRADELVEPPAATDEMLHLAHEESYVARMQAGQMTAAEMKAIGFPWSDFLVERSRRSSGATIEAAKAALADGASVNLAGGTHHAYADHGEGYCLFNDSIIAARVLQALGLVERVVVIDLDVHQGNGTAAIARHDDSIFTFSVHGAKNYPWRKEQSDLDCELPDGTTDAVYLQTVDTGLAIALEKSRPNLAIYLAGADPYENDRLGRLKVSKAGLAERDRLVFDTCRALRLPVAVTMAGGYAKEVEDTVSIHWATVRQAIALASSW